jgi:hypothetical protein
MDYLVASFGWYALAAFGLGFVMAWITCARVER